MFSHVISACTVTGRQPARRSYPRPEVRGGAERNNPTSKERWLRRRRRAERSYSTSKVGRGGHEEIPLVQGKAQWLSFAGAAMKRDSTFKVRETQEGRRCCERASGGRHTETILTGKQLSRLL